MARSRSGEMRPYSARCVADVVEGHALDGARQPEDDVARERALAALVHRREARRRGVTDGLRDSPRGARAREDVDVEGGEVGRGRSACRCRHAADAVGEIGAGPVEHRHEVVADDLDAGVGEVARGSAGRNRNVRATSPFCFLMSSETGRLSTTSQARPEGVPSLRRGDLALAIRDLLGGPDGAVRDVVERRDHALDPGLEHVVDRDAILRAEPAPCLPHRASLPALRPFVSLATNRPCRPAAKPLGATSERWPSGRRHTPAKGAGGEPSRGFESLPLRHHL